MKGLLLKEWYLLTRNFKSMFIVIFIFAAFGFFYDMAVITIVPVLIASVPVSTTALDERSGWSCYADALPVTRKNIVDSKYISGLVCIFCTALMFACLNAVRNGISASLELFIFQISGAAIYLSLMMPVVLHFGTEKARYINMAVIAAFAMLVTALMLAVSDASGDIPVRFAVPALLAALVTLILSEFISVLIYKRKEF